MSLDERPFCRVYLDHRGPTEEIYRLISRLVGVPSQWNGVTTDELEISVDHGDKFPLIEERDYTQWINWKYSLEVYPAADGVGEAQVAGPLKTLLERLHGAGVKTVPACNFEELLSPWNLTDAKD